MTLANAASETELSVSELDAVSGGLFVGDMGGVKAVAGGGVAGVSVGGIGVMVSEGGHAVTFIFGSHKIKLHD